MTKEIIKVLDEVLSKLEKIKLQFASPLKQTACANVPEVLI